MEEGPERRAPGPRGAGDAGVLADPDLPSYDWRALIEQLPLGVIYLVFATSVFLHGLVIWPDPFRRAAALVAGAAIVGMTAAIARRGAFAPRANVELRAGDGVGTAFAVTAGAGPP
jgi:hypothetical protein